MILKKLSEAKVKGQYSDLITEIKSKDSKLAELRDTTITNIIQIFKKDSTDELTADNVISWFNTSGTFGEFVFFYAEDISTYSISDFAEHEPKLANAIRAVLKKSGIIDDEDHDLTLASTYHNDPEKIPENSHKMTILEMCTCLFDTVTEVRDPNDSSKSIKSKETYLNNIAEVEEEYNKLHEDVEEEKVEISQPEEVVEIPTEEQPVEEPKEEISEAIFSDMINSAIQKQWEVIGNLNSIIATFDYEYKAENKEDVLSILNQLVDDNTISVGMLYKASELISTRMTSLVDAGQEKAEDIITEQE